MGQLSAPSPSTPFESPPHARSASVRARAAIVPPPPWFVTYAASYTHRAAPGCPPAPADDGPTRGARSSRLKPAYAPFCATSAPMCAARLAPGAAGSRNDDVSAPRVDAYARCSSVMFVLRPGPGQRWQTWTEQGLTAGVQECNAAGAAHPEPGPACAQVAPGQHAAVGLRGVDGLERVPVRVRRRPREVFIAVGAENSAVRAVRCLYSDEQASKRYVQSVIWVFQRPEADAHCDKSGFVPRGTGC